MSNFGCSPSEFLRRNWSHIFRADSRKIGRRKFRVKAKPTNTLSHIFHWYQHSILTRPQHSSILEFPSHLFYPMVFMINDVTTKPSSFPHVIIWGSSWSLNTSRSFTRGRVLNQLTWWRSRGYYKVRFLETRIQFTWKHQWHWCNNVRPCNNVQLNNVTKPTNLCFHVQQSSVPLPCPS